MLDLFDFGQGDRTSEDVRLEPAIGIGEEQPIARSALRAEMTGVTFAEPVFGQNVDALRFHARILSGDAFEDLRSFVPGTVVDRDDFKIDAFKRKDVTQGL